MTQNPLKLGFTPQEFSTYIRKIHPQKFSNGTSIEGAVLHNTFMPDLKMVNGYLDSKKWTAEQLIDNWWVSYRKQGWQSGPHIFVFPHKIYVATPLTDRGTHSPSFNKAQWGLEMVGDYSHETLPKEMRDMGVHVFAEMFKSLGKNASNGNFHFHGEDPRTSHKHCPGVNVGPKSQWIADINSHLATLK